mgnify:FL=1
MAVEQGAATLTEEEEQLAGALYGARLRFSSYVPLVHGWKWREHQRVWAVALDKLSRGKLRLADGRETNKLMILAPRKSGKTETVKEYCAWMMGYRRALGLANTTIGYISHGENIVRDRSLAIREVIEKGELYRICFPEVVPKKDVGSEYSSLSWGIEEGVIGKTDPTFRAAGIQTGITGARIDTLLVYDDPHSAEQLAEGELQHAWYVHSNVLRYCADPMTPRVVIGTPYKAADLLHRLPEEEKDWLVLRTQALAGDGEGQPYVTYWPREETKDGNWVGVSVETLLAERDSDWHSFMTQRQCLLPREQGRVFRHIPQEETPSLDEVKYIVWAWDTAFTRGKKSDYSAGGEWWVLGDGRLFLADVVRFQKTAWGVIQEVEAQRAASASKTGKQAFAIVEAIGTGTPMADVAVQNSPYTIKWQPVKKPLSERAALPSTFFENKKAFIPSEHRAWKQQYLNEMLGFPDERYDDQVAMTTLMVEYYAGRKVRPLPTVSTSWGRFV